MGRCVRDFVALLAAARPIKLVPLWALIAAGVLVAPAPVRVEAAATATLGIVAASLAAMHINIFTDVELDRVQKPQLWAVVLTRREQVKIVLAAELLVTGLSCAVLAVRSDPALASLVALYTVMGVLYSFNFLAPGRAQRTRFKVHWAGHFAAMFTVYVCSWSIGFLACETDGDQFWSWLPLFALLSLSDYAMFIAESSFDALQERQAKLRTLAALRGRTGSTRIALLLSATATAGLWLAGGSRPAVMLAFVPPAVVTTAALLWLSWGRDGGVVRRGRTVVDGVFIANRIYILLVLAVLAGSPA